MDKHVVVGGAVGMFLFAGLDTLGLVAPFIETRVDAEIATFIVYGGGIGIGMLAGEIVRRLRQ